MNVIVTITDNGNPREAIPVRAIAWATSFKVTPYVLAMDLSKSSDHPPKLKNATAYYSIGSGKARAMAPKEWDAILHALSTLREDMKATDLTIYDNLLQWKIRATGILPAGTFLWKDEFDLAYQRGYGSPAYWIGEEREGDRGYTGDPVDVPEHLQATILEGFGATCQPAEDRAEHLTEQHGEPAPVFAPATVPDCAGMPFLSLPALARYWAHETHTELNDRLRTLCFGAHVWLTSNREFRNAYRRSEDAKFLAVSAAKTESVIDALSSIAFRGTQFDAERHSALLVVDVMREDFANWCTRNQIPLPRFWFLAPADEASQPEATEDVLFEETFSLEEAKIKLRERLNANDYEIERWILDGWIQAYRHHRFRDDSSCSKAEPFAHDDEGNEERRINLDRRLLREEVKRFDPSTPGREDQRPSDYPEFPLVGYNPSGRFVSYRQAVEFLSAFPGATVADVKKRIRWDVEKYRIDVCGFTELDSPLEEGHFYESQIVAIATAHFGRPFDGWDAITRPHPAAPLDDERLPNPAVAAVSGPPEHQSPQQPREPAPTAAGTPGENDRDPRSLKLIVDVDGARVTVIDNEGASETFSREQITGKGKSTWLLLVLFASRYGTVEKDGPEAKKLNYAKNRSNLGEKLKQSLRLRESPFVVGDASTIKFTNIRAERESIDAMNRGTLRLDDAATDWLAAHGEEMPVIE